MSKLRFAPALVTIFVGCGASRVEPTPPAPTAPTAASTSATPSAEPIAPASASAVASTEPVVEPPSSEDPCRAASFDLASLPAQCRAKEFKTEATPGAFTARLVPDTPKVHAGDDLPVTVEFLNTSKTDAVLAFVTSCMQLEAQAFRNGKRADWINEGCGFGGGCGGLVTRVTITPGGKATAQVVLHTKVRKVQKTDCSEIETGPLAAGSYEVRVSVGAFFPLADELGKARAKIEATK